MQLQQVFGAMRLAHAELIWYFCHFDEVRGPSVWRYCLLGPQTPGADMPC